LSNRIYIIGSIILIAITFTWLYFSDKEIYLEVVKGRVIDAATKEPISDAIVSIHWETMVIEMTHRYGPSLWVDETKTDNDGRFTFKKKDPFKVKSSTKFWAHTPTIGVIKKGYMPVLEPMYYKKSKAWFSNELYMLYENQTEILLEKRFLDDLNMVDSGRISMFISNVERISTNKYCFIKKIPNTISELKNMFSQFTLVAIQLGCSE